jgi:hypothetical protein
MQPLPFLHEAKNYKGLFAAQLPNLSLSFPELRISAKD